MVIATKKQGKAAPQALQRLYLIKLIDRLALSLRLCGHSLSYAMRKKIVRAQHIMFLPMKLASAPIYKGCVD